MPEQLSETLHFTKNWQQQLAEAFNNIENLCNYLNYFALYFQPKFRQVRILLHHTILQEIVYFRNNQNIVE